MPSKFACLILTLLLLAPFQSLEGSEVRKLRKSLEKAAQENDTKTALGVVRDLAVLGTEDAFDAIFDAGVKWARNQRFYDSVIKSLRGFDGFSEKMQARIKKARKAPEKIFACDTLAGVKSATTVEIVAPLLKDKVIAVQIAAIHCLEQSRRREAVGALIARYEKLLKMKKKGPDVVLFDVTDALFDLTGNDFEFIDEWWQWWEPVQNSFDPDEEKDARTAVVRKPRNSQSSFFGVPIGNGNVCFVIDTSGSMVYVQNDRLKQKPGLDDTSGGNDKPMGGADWEEPELAIFWTRIEMAKRELTQAIELMHPSASFNVLYFDDSVTRVSKRAGRATPKNKKAAVSDLDSQVKRFWDDWNDQTHGRRTTNTLEALKAAFHDPRTDTIFFLSDGLPSKDGEAHDPTEPILEEVFRLNRFRKVKIHTFGFADVWNDLDSANQWLEKLAKKTGGQFTTMKVDPRCTPDNPYPDRKKKKGRSSK